MNKEGSGIRVSKPWTFDTIRAKSTEEGECLLWDGATTMKGFPYAYLGGDKVNLRPYVYGTILGKTLRKGHVISVGCGHRTCLSESCLVQKTISQVRKEVHRKLKLDPASYAKTRNGIKAAGLMKLDMTKAQAIRESDKTAKELAADFGVTTRTIHEIRSGQTYTTPRLASSIFTYASTL